MIQKNAPKYFMLNCKFIAPGLTYENYLLDILNWSRYFRCKSRDRSEYKAPQSQDKGEADAYSSEYAIDFKLLVNEEVMCALSKNKPMVNKAYIKQGVIFVNDNPHPSPIPNKDVLAEIMSITDDEIKNHTFASSTAEHLFSNLEKEKNLFLFYPYEFVSNRICTVAAFAIMLTKVFKRPLSYRKQRYPDKDTYVCIKVNEWFLIFKWEEYGFACCDIINEAVCSTYSDYKLFSFF